MARSKGTFRKGHIPWHKGKKMSKSYKLNHSMEMNGRWKGGRRIRKDGYVEIRIAPKIVFLEHRLVVEKCIGRKLAREEIVHHKNRIRHDNSIHNLHPMTNRKHSSMHILELWRTPKHREKMSRIKIGNKHSLGIKRNKESIRKMVETKRIKRQSKII